MPRNVTVTLSNGNPHTYRNVPDNVTPDQIEQRAAKEFPGVRVVSISGGRKAQPAPEAQQPWYESALSGFERGIKPVADFVSAIDPTKYAVNAVTDYFAPGMRQRGENALAAHAQQAQRQNPYSYGGGKLAGNIFATLPVGPVLGATARLATAGTKAARVGEVFAKGLSSGGLKTGLIPTRAAIKAGTAAPTLGARAVDLAIRAETGAATGAVSAGLTGDDAIAGSLVGALVPTAGAAVARVALDKVILPAYERLSGQLGKVRAAAILQKAFNMPIDAVIALARNAPEGVPFAKVVAQASKNEPKFQALAAKMAEGPGKHIYGPIARAETQAQQDTLNAMARGGTEREARNALATGRKAIGKTYADAEKQAFAQANQNTQRVAPLTAQAAQAEREAAWQTALARQGPLASAASLAAPQEADRLAAAAAAARQQIADLEAQGIHALETGPMASQIRKLAGAEGVGPYQKQALLTVAKQIEDRGPIIRAGDLDAIRDEANYTINDMLKGHDVSGVNSQTAKLLSNIKPIIDTAIGHGYPEAKAAFAAGATEGERQGFAGQLAGIFAKDQPAFADIVRGAYGTTGTVEKAFSKAGGRNFDIQEMMAPHMPALENLAGQVELKGSMAAQAAEGEHLASGLLKNPPQESDIFSLANRVKMPAKLGAVISGNPILAAGMHIIDLAHSANLDAATQKALAEGLQNGKTAEELLTLIPLADRKQIAQRLASYGLFSPRNVVNAAGRNTSNAMFNAATAVPSDQNQNAMAGY